MSETKVDSQIDSLLSTFQMVSLLCMVMPGLSLTSWFPLPSQALSRFGLTNQWAPLCPHHPRSLVSPGRWKTVVEQLARSVSQLSLNECPKAHWEPEEYTHSSPLPFRSPRWARFSYLPIGASLFKHSMVRAVIKKKDGQSTEQERGEKRRKER